MGGGQGAGVVGEQAFGRVVGAGGAVEVLVAVGVQRGQLRTADWFRTEYGLPYSTWPAKLAKKAVTAHRMAQTKLAAATTTEEAKEVLAAFVQTFNTLPGIEASEREDLGQAVTQLVSADNAAALLTPAQAQQIFDQERDY